MSEIAATRVNCIAGRHECNQDIAATELCTKNCRNLSAILAQHDSHFNVHRHRLYQPLCLGCLRSLAVLVGWFLLYAGRALESTESICRKGTYEA